MPSSLLLYISHNHKPSKRGQTMNNHFVMNNKNRTKLLRQNNTTFSFNRNGRIITVVASTPLLAEMALVDVLRRNK